MGVGARWEKKGGDGATWKANTRLLICPTNRENSSQDWKSTCETEKANPHPYEISKDRKEKAVALFDFSFLLFNRLW